jgi:peptide/nickel transport system permease protein
MIQRVLASIGAQWRRDRSLVIWAGILVVIVLVSVCGPFFLADPNFQTPARRLEGPSAEYLLGTDNFGRDLLSRVVNAGRVSLSLGLLITVLSVALGSVIGLVSGFYRGASAVLMRFMDALLSFPVIVLSIALVVALGSGSGVLGEAISLTVVFVPYVARVVRGRTLELAQRGYVTAARASGTHSAKVLLIHILPNALPTILVQSTFIYASTLLADASLSFLGLGVAPPTATWGNMIADARPFMTSAPLFIIVPGLAIVLAVMAFNLTGDGIRTLIDPRARAVMSLQLLLRGKARQARQAKKTPALSGR